MGDHARHHTDQGNIRLFLQPQPLLKLFFIDSFSGEIVREPSLSDILEASEEAKRRALA